MAQFPGSPKRLDPYKNFKFRVYFGDNKATPVLGVSKVGGLKRTTEVVSHRDGAVHNHSFKAPGRTNFEPITLERGVTHDPEFEEWANKMWAVNAEAGAHMALKSFRKDIYIEVLNEAGDKAMGFTVYRCWVSEYQAMSDLDANANAVLIEHLRIEHEGWVRDPAVQPPADMM